MPLYQDERLTGMMPGLSSPPMTSLPVATMTIAKQGLNKALDLQGFVSAINHGEEMAAYNSEANKSNPDC